MAEQRQQMQGGLRANQHAVEVSWNRFKADAARFLNDVRPVRVVGDDGAVRLVLYNPLPEDDEIDRP